MLQVYKKTYPFYSLFLCGEKKERRSGMAKKKTGEMERKRVSEQDTTLRCLNCFERIKIEFGTDRVTCFGCGEEYILGWRGKGKKQAKILGVPIPGKHI